MKILQANIWNGALIRSFQRLLRKEMPDILMLQEVSSSPQGQTAYFDNLQDLQETTGLEHVFFSPMWSSEFMRKPIHFGLAILSRFPLFDTYQEYVHLEYEPDFDFAKHDYNIRLFQHACVRKNNGNTVNLVNYHGYHDPKGKEGNDVTMRICNRIADYMETLQEPKILTGDFNLAPHSTSLSKLNDAYDNLIISHNVETTRNELARNMTPVDFIWVSRDVEVRRFEVSPELVSDHAALILEIA